MTFTGHEIRSTLSEHGELVLALEPIQVDDPADNEVVVRVEATPINPSDIGLLLGPADLSTMKEVGTNAEPRIVFEVPQARLPGVRGRIGQAMAVGSEGAGTVVAAGKSAAHLMGKRVGMSGGGMYATHRKVPAQDVIELPEGAAAADGASMFINPLTALGFVETAVREGHKAIVHTPAASNLGQILQKICLADGIPLVNIVRSEDQAVILRNIGATYVLNSKDPDFAAQLTAAIQETGATIAFDAIGGGTLGSDILQAMERAFLPRMTEYSRYGTDVFKQLYIYGGLDLSPSILNRVTFGYEWSVSAWLVFNYLRKTDPKVVSQLRERVRRELKTTFSSHYTRTVGLAEALRPDVIRAFERKATGEKFLIDPSKAG